MPTLSNWSITFIPAPYLAPELHHRHLQGQVYNHSDFSDGESILTSRIIGRIGEAVKTSSGSLYTLGTVDPNYEAEYPNARERLLASLPE